MVSSSAVRSDAWCGKRVQSLVVSRMIVYFYILLLASVASFIQRVSGFGFGIFVMMFFPFFIPTFGEAITISGLLAGVTSFLIAVRNWHFIRWRRIGILFLANVWVSYFAISFMAGLANGTLKKGLGVLLILIALYFLLGHNRRPLSVESKTVQVVVGGISGVTGGMFAMPGPPIVLYCINAFSDKREYIATLQTLFFCSNVFYTLFRAQAGFFTDHTLGYASVGLLGLLVGTRLGARCFERISGPQLKRIVYILMIVSGIVTLC